MSIKAEHVSANHKRQGLNHILLQILPNGIFSETLPNERQYFLNTSMFMSLKLQFVFHGNLG